jgi:CRT10
VAHQDTVAVFQPSFPLHVLGGQPQVNIVPNLANSNAQGYLNPSRPHAVNHLLVGELGSEEILLLSTDSGNVAAYYTAGIQDGIEKEPYKFSKDGRSDLVGVRPFFTHWVHESAWGLSIHKRARMLAVSSNKPNPIGVYAVVTVFAFALIRSNEKSSRASQGETTSAEEDLSEWRSWAPDGTALPERSVNWKTKLAAHKHNIPSVSFINSDDDREGNYLLSTDIEGVTKCWHIWQGNATCTWDFSRPMRRSSNPYLDSRRMS